MTKNILFGLIVATAAIFSMIYFSVGLYVQAGIALIAGIFWLSLEIRERQSFPTTFFLLFVGLVVVGALNRVMVLLLLAGLCAAIAAWDLSRFIARTRDKVEAEMKAVLEARHLQKLLVVTGLGFVIALPPTVVNLSLNFLTLAVLTLVMLLMLRASLLYLRRDDKGEN